jgi:uncharacterized membrane protein required for colicin V production
MPLVDIVLILIIGGFTLMGFMQGFIRTVGNLVATILGLYLTGRLIGPFTDRFSFLGGGTVGLIFSYVILYTILSRLIGIGFWFGEKVLGILSWIPFAKSINRVLGAVFGLIEGMLVVGAVTFFAVHFLPMDTLRSAIEQSPTALYLVGVMSGLQGFLPQVLKLVPVAFPK